MTHAEDLSRLGRDDRLKLLRFVIAFAWADLAISPSEIAHVHRLVARLKLEPEEAARVERWLKSPPPPEEIDPTEIPPQHRQLFIDAVREMATADGEMSEEEKESLDLLERLSR
jgi:uncharacterized tellurite resistance protein B-like protein